VDVVDIMTFMSELSDVDAVSELLFALLGGLRRLPLVRKNHPEHLSAFLLVQGDHGLTETTDTREEFSDLKR
jgi:hypothetical protein